MKEGYPEQHELNTIKNYDINKSFELIEYIRSMWCYNDFIKTKWIKYNDYYCYELELHTGGWSGNEDIVKALLGNEYFNVLFYFSWERGGHYVFIVNPYNLGYLKVSEYCERYNISRQAIHKSKYKYEWLNVSKNFNYIKLK